MNLSLGDTQLIIAECRVAKLLRSQTAYVLATALHETAHTMKPIHERGSHGYFDKYEPSTRSGKRLGNTVQGDGFKYRGRGYVQLTGRANYANAGSSLFLNMIDLPDMALDPAIAARIMVIGMRDGWFTGKKVGAYVTLGKSDFHEARRVVNGLDRADDIAIFAVQYDAALKPVWDGPRPAPAPTEPPRARPGWLALWQWLTGAK